MDALRLPLYAPGSPVPSRLTEVGPARAHGLADRFGRRHDYLRISVTERCNLRCKYCMPEEGVTLLPRDTLLSYEEIERLASLFVRLGVRKIRLTGGEPLVRKGFVELAARLGALKRGAPALETLAMTSNALLLEPLLPALVAAGLDAVNLSLDTLREDRFRQITGRGGCAETQAAIHAAARAGLRSVKVNVVAMAGVNEDELVALARAFARDWPIEVRYIEYMPFEGNGWGEELEMFPASSIRARLERELSLTPLGQNDGGTGTAQLFAAADADGTPFAGKLGVISSMTEPFCDTCTRLRLTADGHFRWCLLDEGELDLRAPLRAGASDAELASVIEQGLARKEPAHAAASALTAAQHALGPTGARSMIRIGG